MRVGQSLLDDYAIGVTRKAMRLLERWFMGNFWTVDKVDVRRGGWESVSIISYNLLMS